MFFRWKERVTIYSDGNGQNDVPSGNKHKTLILIQYSDFHQHGNILENSMHFIQHNTYGLLPALKDTVAKQSRPQGNILIIILK
jgi:hypothetical protein